jgi:hypothetical protein
MISPTSSAEPITTTSSAFANFVLKSTRVAKLRAQLIGNEIAAAGVALESGMIDAEMALVMLGEAGLLPLVEASS